MLRRGIATAEPDTRLTSSLVSHCQIGLHRHTLLYQRRDAAVLADDQQACRRLRGTAHGVGHIERTGIDGHRTAGTTRAARAGTAGCRAARVGATATGGATTIAATASTASTASASNGAAV